MTTWWEQSSPGVGSFNEIRWFRELDSTNAYLLAEIAAGAPSGLVAIADVQTHGRGRRDRAWTADPGAGLLCSMLVSAERGVPLFAYNAALALSACDAIEETTGVAVSCKWPNDLMIEENKLGGILLETITQGDVTAVVAGIGINLLPSAFPPDVTNAVALSAYGVHVDRDELLFVLLRHYSEALGDIEKAIPRFQDACVTVGQEVKVLLDTSEIVGTAIGINSDGGLIVQSPGGEHVVHTGDVVHVR